VNLTRALKGEPAHQMSLSIDPILAVSAPEKPAQVPRLSPTTRTLFAPRRNAEDGTSTVKYSTLEPTSVHAVATILPFTAIAIGRGRRALPGRRPLTSTGTRGARGFIAA